MENVICIAIIVLIAFGAGYYIYRAKKNGVRCIGCSSGKSCDGSCGSCGACHCEDSEQKSQDAPSKTDK